MKVIPALDIMKGEVVRLVEGRPETAQRFGDPLIWASKFVSDGAERLHLIDLDRAFDPQSRQEKPVMKISHEIRSIYPGIDQQIGGGLRTTEDVEEVISTGGFAIVGTRAIQDHEWLKEISARWPERVIVAIDVRGGMIQTHAWTKDSGMKLEVFADRIFDAGIKTILYTLVDLDGRLAGVTIERVREPLDTFPGIDLIWAGGISSLEDIRILRDEGAFGCVLGSCLYFNKVKLRDAIRVAQGKGD